MSDKVVLILGSNIGDRISHLVAARGRLSDFGEITGTSRVFLTSAYGVRNQPDFFNTALMLETEMSHWELLEVIKNLERELGRNDEQRHGPRVIDIDIALWGHTVLDEPELTIPHKGLSKRDFFIRPILDILPEAIDPRSGKKLSSSLSGIRFSELTVKNIVEDDRWLCITI